MATAMAPVFADLSVRAWSALGDSLILNVIVARLKHRLAEIVQLVVRVLGSRSASLADIAFDSTTVSD